MEKLEKKFISSMEVAEMVDKTHANLLKDIRSYISKLAEVNFHSGELFVPSEYKDANNQSRTCFNITQKGCEFIANKLTGQKGCEFTAKYVNRFHEMQDALTIGKFENAKSPTEMIALMKMSIATLEKVNEKVEEHDARMDYLENKMVIDYGQQRVLEQKVAETVIKCLGGKGSNAYKTLNRKIFAMCNGQIKKKFNVNSRCNIPKAKFDDAIEFIEKWYPDALVRDEINELNTYSQGELQL